MSATAGVLAMPSGAARPLADVPRHDLGELRRLVIGARSRGRRVSALFGHPVTGGLEPRRRARGRRRRAGRARADRARRRVVPSMTPECPQVHLFERELARAVERDAPGAPVAQAGALSRAVPPGRRLAHGRRRTGDRRDRLLPRRGRGGARGRGRAPCTPASSSPATSASSATASTSSTWRSRSATNTAASSGRCSAARTSARIHYVETLAGDTTIGHATAYCQALEALAGAAVPARGLALRGDRARARTAGQPHRRPRRPGRRRRLPARPPRSAGACAATSSTSRRCCAAAASAAAWSGRAASASMSTQSSRRQLASNASSAPLRDVDEALPSCCGIRPRCRPGSRTSGGCTRRNSPRDLGSSGPAARACGLRRDVRTTTPPASSGSRTSPSRPCTPATSSRGPSCAGSEIQRSVEFVREQLRELPRGAARVSAGAPLAGARSRVSLVEGWRGEICHVAMTDAQGACGRTRSSIRRSTTGPAWPWRCATSRSRTSRSATRASTCRTAVTTCEENAMLNILRRTPEPRAPHVVASPTERRSCRPLSRPARDRRQQCADGCRACADACPTDAITVDAARLALDLGRCLFCTDCTHACPEGAIEFTADYRLADAYVAAAVRRPARLGHGPGTASGTALARHRARRRSALELVLASCAVFRPVVEAAPGQRRRLQRLRGRHQRARHPGLRSGAVRHPVRRLAPARRRPDHHRPGHREHEARPAKDLRRAAPARDRHRRRRLRHLGRALRRPPRGSTTAPIRSCPWICTSPAARPTPSRSSRA